MKQDEIVDKYEVLKMARQACPYTSEKLRGAFYDGFVNASKLVAAKYEQKIQDLEEMITELQERQECH